MSLRRYLYIFRFPLLLCLFFCAFSQQAAAQSLNRDSLAQARQRVLDSTRTARQHVLDSTRAARQHSLDSIRAARQHVTDSLNALREYRNSKRYKDSVENIRNEHMQQLREAQQARIDSMRAIQKATADSLVAARKRITDSTIAARKAYSDSLISARKAFNDSLTAVRKARTDSLAAITKYRNSKRYKDSVVIVRRQYTDSLKAVRKAFSDSLIAARKRTTDSTIAARKAFSDSLTAVRKAFNDSLTAVRKARTDSLAAIRKKREELQKVEKDKKFKMEQLALELKFKKKREAWSNTKMLKKKWSLPRRVVQNTFTRYNYYFNAQRKMEEAQANMARLARDDFDKPIPLYSFDPNRDSSALKPDMDSIVQHASLGIQIHDPRTKWGDDLYLLMGQAYYYMGNYDQAIASFQYIIGSRQQQKTAKLKKAGRNKTKEEKNKLVDAPPTGALGWIKHDPANNAALLWLVRTYTQAGNYEMSESILDLLRSEPALPEAVKQEMAEQDAFLALKRLDVNTATSQLTLVSANKDAGKILRTRAAFLNGQLLQQTNHPEEAAGQYQTVIDLHPGLEMGFYARRNMAYALLATGQDASKALSGMKEITRDNKYAAYHSQAYYIMGQVAAANGHPRQAVDYLAKSVKQPKISRQQKAISYAALGNAYYALRQYGPAQAAYDSTTLLAAAAKGDTLVEKAVKRGASLKKITAPLSNIAHQDSLLALSRLSEKEQLAVVRRHIRALEKQREDSVSSAENPVAAAGSTGGGSTPATGGLSWYFSNPAMVQSGELEFKRKWGNRPLTDNWRRAAAIRGGVTPATPAAGSGTAGSATAGSDVELDENGLPTEASLYALIPNSEEQKQKANTQLQRAYVDMATAYVNLLDDYTQGAQALDTLEQRFPAHPHKAEALYLRYQMALRQNNMAAAQSLSQQLLSQYGGSHWASLVRPAAGSSPEAGEAPAVPVGAYYEATYQLLQQRQYAQTIAQANLGEARYNDPAYNHKFTVVKAMAQAGQGQYNDADSLLKAFIKENPSDSLRGWAEQVLLFIQKRKAEAPATPAVPAAPATAATAALPADSIAAPAVAAVPASFTYKAAAPHYFVFSFPEMASKTMGLKAALGDFNRLKFSGQALENNVYMLSGNSGIIVAGPFNNAAQAKSYFNTFKSTPDITREYKPDEYQIFIISEENLGKLRHDKDLPAYMNFYRSKYR